MPAARRQIRPRVDRLDMRVVMSASVATGAADSSVLLAGAHQAAIPPIPGSHPSANSNRPFTPADLQAYAQAYLANQGVAGYTPQYDFHGTGFIGQNDATPILRGLATITPQAPLRLSLGLAPGEQVQGQHPSDSGGVTRLAVVTVVGKTTPNSVVFIDGPTLAHPTVVANFKFEGGAVTTNSEGSFADTVVLAADSRGGSLTTPVFLIRTPFHQQLIRAFPIRRLP